VCIQSHQAASLEGALSAPFSATAGCSTAAKTRLPAGTLIPRRASLAVTPKGAGATTGVFAIGLSVTAVQILIRRACRPVSAASRIDGAIGVDVTSIGLILVKVVPVRLILVKVVAVNLILVEVVPIDLILTEGIPVYVARVDVVPVHVVSIHVIHVYVVPTHVVDVNVVPVVVVASVHEGVAVGHIHVPVVRHAAAMPAAAPTIPSPTV